jgi:Uri superfamily endonuclease
MGITVEDAGRDAERGTYTLIMLLREPRRLKIGALGELYFSEGYYAYTGSALGGGGFARVRRHKAVASGKNRTRQWRIDYLLPYVEVVEVATSPRPECTVASYIDRLMAGVPGFGCSDCRCPTHLHYSEDLEKMIKAVNEAHHVV